MAKVLRSRLLTRIDAAIAKAKNPVDVACLKAERAGFLARQGHVDQARKIITDLHAQFAWRPHAAVSAWLSLSEGLVDHFSNLGASARDRVQRAYALSGAAHLAPLRALSAAWLAHMDFVQHEMSQMARHVAEALNGAGDDHHSARSRACLVVGYAYHFGGRLDLAQPWYALTRKHAVADGDEAAISALMHNQAWMRGAQARVAGVFGEAVEGEPGDAARQALMTAQSSQHFDIGVGTASLGSLTPMLQAQLLVSLGRHAEALELYRANLDAAMSDGLERLRPCFLADMLWCRLQLGDRAGATADVAVALGSLDMPCDIDDRAVAHARMAAVLRALGREGEAAPLEQIARRDLNAHRAEQARLVALLDDALESVTVR